MPGHAGESGQPLDASVLNRLRTPHEFLQKLNQIIDPGATILVTQAPVLPTNSGKQMTILSSVQKR